MNYLAHIFLSGDDAEMRVGGLLGDFVKGPLRGDLPEKIEQGIMLHRKIDAYTDQMPEIQAATARFEKPHRRFAGIYLDMCFDHFLAIYWQDFHRQSLADYCGEFYRQLSGYYPLLPDRAQRFSKLAPEINWLESYADFRNLEHMLERVGDRLKRPAPLHSGFALLQRDYQLIEREFYLLFPRLIDFADSHRQQL